MGNHFIGLLGGSFNPAHDGHLHISVEAQKRLGLKKIWWMVSPQNPLKPTQGMAPFAERFAGAQAFVQSRHSSSTEQSEARSGGVWGKEPHRTKCNYITVTDIENRLHTRYTIDTLRKLKRRFPKLQFVWLMGADNLATIHRWQEWEKIFALVPILVLDRSLFSHSALRKKASLRFAKYRKNPRALTACAALGLPAWAYTHMRRHSASSTKIRKNLEKSQK